MGLLSTVKDIFNPEPKLSEQETLVKEIFTELLELPDTNKVLVNVNCSYLSNERMGITAVIDDNEVVIEHGSETLMLKCGKDFMFDLGLTINKSVKSNVSDLFDRMTNRQTKTLQEIEGKISSRMNENGTDESENLVF